MANSLIRLKRQPDKYGEDRVVIKVQFKQRQYPVPVPNLKINPKFFDENNYGGWLLKSYQSKSGQLRNKTAINKKIKSLKSKIDIALENLIDAGFEKFDVKIIKRAIGKTGKEIKKKRQVMVDSFYEEPILEIYKDNFLDQPFVNKDKKNLYSTLRHLENFQDSSGKVFLMNDLNNKLLDEFTYFLIDWQFKKGDKNDPFAYLSHDTVYKQIKKLRKFRNYCITKLGKEFENLSYSFPYRGTLNVVNPQALYPFELDLIFKTHLEYYSESLHSAKKLFLLSYAIGGQRISDVIPIVKEKIYKKDLIEYVQNKTGKQMHAGLLNQYFDPFKEETLPIYSGKHINTLLKEIIKYFVFMLDENFGAMRDMAEDLGIKDPFERKVQNKSYRGRSSKPCWSEKLLEDDFSFGYARSTFISHMIFRYGKTKEETMLYTGHSSERTIEYYLDVKKKIETYKKDKDNIKPDDRYDYESYLDYRDSDDSS